MLEETFIRLVKPFEDFLDGLAVQTASADALREVSFHSCTGTVFPRQGIVSLLQGECVIPYETGLTQHRIELAVAFGTVQLVFVCQHIQIYEIIWNYGSECGRFHPPFENEGFPAPIS